MASVKGNLHDIGKNKACLMLRVNGIDVIDTGVDVSPRDVLEKAKEPGVDRMGMSSLMTTSMPLMQECVELWDGFGQTDEFMESGAPLTITTEYTAEIGADGYSKDAVDAVAECLVLLDGPA